MVDRANQPLGDEASADRILTRGSGVHFRCWTRVSRGLSSGAAVPSRIPLPAFSVSFYFSALNFILWCITTVMTFCRGESNRKDSHNNIILISNDSKVIHICKNRFPKCKLNKLMLMELKLNCVDGEAFFSYHLYL